MDAAEDGGMRNKREIRGLVEGIAKSWMTGREYCAKHGVAMTTLDYRRHAQRKQKPRLVEVEVEQSEPVGGFELACSHYQNIQRLKCLSMEITANQYACIRDTLPVQRGNVRLTNLQVLNAILYVAEHGCKWRGLPKRFGRWHTIYTRMNRWAKNGVLDRVFEKLQREQIVRIQIEALAQDSTSVKVHPDGTGVLKKTDRKPSESPAEDGTPRFIWLPRMLER
jgi:transposase